MLETARTLGLDVPPSLLDARRRGDRVMKRREFVQPSRRRGGNVAACGARAANRARCGGLACSKAWPRTIPKDRIALKRCSMRSNN